jgi:hypothetical protein
MKVRNALLALLLSLTLTFGLAVNYTFYPLIFMVLRAIFSNRESGGIAMVAGGMKTKLLWALLVVEPLLFLLAYSLLQRRDAAR